jgi:hypothetical protein
VRREQVIEQDIGYRARTAHLAITRVDIKAEKKAAPFALRRSLI